MEINKEKKNNNIAMRICAIENGKEIGRAWLYFIYNDMHAEPYGLVEDVFVDESARGKGLGTKLLQEVVVEAKKQNCYKLIATVRSHRNIVCSWYEKFGFKNYGVEFRLDL